MTKIKSLLNQLFNYAIANKITDINYAALVKIPKGAEAGTIQALTNAEFKVLENNWQNVKGGDAVYALCFLGFRVSEFCQLSPASYDKEAHTLKGGLNTEVGKNRTVPVHSSILPLVEGWAAANHEVLYADQNGKPYNKDNSPATYGNPPLRCWASLTICLHTALGTPAPQDWPSRSAAGRHPEDPRPRRLQHDRQHIHHAGSDYAEKCGGTACLVLSINRVSTKYQRLRNPRFLQNF